MIELLVVIIIVAILIGLLLPAINGAIRTAKNAAVSAEISQLSQALENFKNRYGDYPPSRLYLSEDGLFPVGPNANQQIPGENITYGELAQQSLAALRKFFPKVPFGTLVKPPLILQGQGTYWYDFNGDGIYQQNAPYILHGHECLVFFLGGIPLADNPGLLTDPNYSPTFSMSGFGSDPTNPFTNNIASDPRPPYNGANNAMYNGNRQPPIFEFNPGRLFRDPGNNLLNGMPAPNYGAQVPGYYDSFGNNAPSFAPTTINFYAYFSAYGNGAYNADDVNLVYLEPGSQQFVYEPDSTLAAPIGLWFPRGASASPNPYTSTLSANRPLSALPTGTVGYQKPQSYQIISAGIDGLYGVGGQYIPSSAANSTASNALPFDANNTVVGAASPPAAETDSSIRIRENDNLTNFKSGKLQ